MLSKAGLMNELLSDARFAAGALRRQPGFTAVIVATLALGIGANTALFSIVDAVLLRPLPVRAPDQLVTVWETGARKSRVAPANFFDWRRESKSFTNLAAFGAVGFTLSGSGEAERVGGARVSANYFDVLGVTPLLGRGFVAQDETPGTSPVILGYELWASRFAKDPAIVGKSVTLDGSPYDVIGVAPYGLYPSWPSATARLSFAARTQQVFVPLRMDAARAANRNSHVLGVVARLRDGVSVADASDEMQALGRRLAALHPNTNAGESAMVSGLQTELTGEVKSGLVILLAAVALLLALACANVASVLLARGTARTREIAVRRTLGASRYRIARLLTTESLLLALTGGLVGCVLAVTAMPVLLALLPPDLPRLNEVAVNGRVLSFALMASVLTGVVFGLWPALRASMDDPARGLRDGAPGSGDREGSQARRGLVVAQVAVALVLVIGGTLLARSFGRLRQVDPGFSPEGLLAFHLDLPARFATPPQIVTAYADLLERFQSVPGVRAGAVAYDSPLESNWIDSFSVEGRPEPEAGLAAHLAIVSSGYFEALGVRVLAGRGIDERDSLNSAGAVVVSQAFALRFFPNESPVGHWLRIGTPSGMNGPSSPTRFQIVGVAADVHSLGLAKVPEPTYYLSAGQFPQRDMGVLLQIEGDPLGALPSLRAELRRFDDAIALSDPTTLIRTIETKVAQPRFNTMALIGFAALALALTSVGLYGLLSYSVARRTREIGVRLALGATREQVRALVLGEGMRLVGTGAVIGVVAAAFAGRMMSALLFGVAPEDTLSFSVGLIALLLAGGVAAFVPARRAAAVTPASALRTD